MKKIKISLIIALFSLTPLMSFAQVSEGDKVLSVNLGVSVTKGAIKALLELAKEGSDSLDILKDYTLTNTPAISATFGYNITDQFSLDGFLSVQNFKGELIDYGFQSSDNKLVLETVSFNANRIYLGLVPKYYYKTESSNLDVYSALRLGYILWNTSIKTSDPSFDLLPKLNGGRPAIALVPIGLRYYFTDNFGLNGELALGAPYLVSIGGHLKF